MTERAYEAGRVVVGRLPRGEDLLAALTAVANRHGVRMGWLQFFGAVQRARLAFYDQVERVYREIVVERPCEIAAGVGNVSLLDGRPFVHAHVILSDESGRCHGGHVLEGTLIYACEYALWCLTGAEPLVRAFDPETHLKLWQGG